jgi:putative oxidoreductase
LVELGPRKEQWSVGLDGFIACEHGLSGLVMSGHYSAHTHAASESPRRVTPLPISLTTTPQKGNRSMSQREISFAHLTATRASGAVVWIRLYVGLIFFGEGILKFMRPETLGPGRFAKVDVPFSTFTAYLDGTFEIGCGLLILVGLAIRLAAVPMITDMAGAIGFTKVPLLWGNAALYPKEGGIGDFFHESRVEVAMLCGSIFLLIVGAGVYSFDAQMNRTNALARVTSAGA